MSVLMKLWCSILLLLVPAILCQPPDNIETITADFYGTSVSNSLAYTGSTLRVAQNNTAFIDVRQSRAVLITGGQTDTPCLLPLSNLISSDSEYDITTDGEWIATAYTGFLGVNEISIFKCNNGTAINIQQFQDADNLEIRAVQFLDGGILMTIASPSYALDYSIAKFYTYDGSQWIGSQAWPIIGPIVFVDPVELPALGDTFSKRTFQFQDDYATFIINLSHSFYQILIYNTTTWTYIDRMTAPDELDKTPFLDVAYNGKDSVIASRSDRVFIMNFINESGPVWEEVYRVNASSLGFDPSFTSGFGFSLASVNPDTFLVSAPTDQTYSNNTGLVLVMKRINGSWSWIANIQSSIKQSYFAQEIAVTKDLIIFDGDVAFQSIPRCVFEPISYECLAHANLTNCDLDPSTICTTEQIACFSSDRFVVKNKTRLSDLTIEVNFEIQRQIAQSVIKSVAVNCPQESPPIESSNPIIVAPLSLSPASPTSSPVNDKGITSNARSIVQGAFFLVLLSLL